MLKTKNKQKKRNTKQFKKQLNKKTNKMNKMNNQNNPKMKTNKKEKSKEVIKLQELLKSYSRNKNVEGYDIVEKLIDDEKLIGNIDNTHFNSNELISMDYEISNIDFENKIIVTRITCNESMTSEFMLNELKKENLSNRYKEWLSGFSIRFGEFILDVFDDFSIQTINYVRIGCGIISSEIIEPKNKTGYRLFPENYQS
jgi:hypothetical protein